MRRSCNYLLAPIWAPSAWHTLLRYRDKTAIDPPPSSPTLNVCLCDYKDGANECVDRQDKWDNVFHGNANQAWLVRLKLVGTLSKRQQCCESLSLFVTGKHLIHVTCFWSRHMTWIDRWVTWAQIKHHVTGVARKIRSLSFIVLCCFFPSVYIILFCCTEKQDLFVLKCRFTCKYIEVRGLRAKRRVDVVGGAYI